MEIGKKENLNDKPTKDFHPARDENIQDTTDLNSKNLGPSTAASNTNATDAATEDDYLTGLKLVAVLAGVTMAAFLMILDLSVVVTVSYQFIFGTLQSQKYYYI